MKQSYAVMIPWYVSANTPLEALEIAIDEMHTYCLKNSPHPLDGYVTKNDYTIEDMENAGFTYVEV